jgi:hypothetical protein
LHLENVYFESKKAGDFDRHKSYSKRENFLLPSSYNNCHRKQHVELEGCLSEAKVFPAVCLTFLSLVAEHVYVKIVNVFFSMGQAYKQTQLMATEGRYLSWYQ